MTKSTTLGTTNIPDEIAAVFEQYPIRQRECLLTIRTLILETAAQLSDVGNLEETLKWGEPSYLTRESKSGSTIRIGPYKKRIDQYAVYFNCQTTLVESFRQMFLGCFQFEKNRAIWFNIDDTVPTKELRLCIAKALCYHLDKRKERR